MNTDKAKEYLARHFNEAAKQRDLATRFTDSKADELKFAIDAMTDFAQQQAQEMAMDWDKWKVENGWFEASGNPDKYCNMEKWPELEYKTFSELWQLFEKERGRSELLVCGNCLNNHTNKEYEGYCSQSCFDGIK